MDDPSESAPSSWGAAAVSGSAVREALATPARAWADLAQPGPGRLALALPWHALPVDGLPAHVVAAAVLAAELVRAAGPHTGDPTRPRTGRAVVHLSAADLTARAKTGDSLAMLVARRLAGLPMGAPADAVPAGRVALVAADLTVGRTILVVNGVIDVDAPSERDRVFVEDEAAAWFFERVKVEEIRHVVLVGRGSGTGANSTVARGKSLAVEGVEFSTEWLVEPPHPVNPLRSHLFEQLTNPGGPAFGQILPLRLHETARDDSSGAADRRLAVARRFLLGDLGVAGDRDPGISPALPRRYVARRAGGPAIPVDLGGLLERLDGERERRGLVLLDAVGPSGGHGKTTTLLGIAAWRHQQGRPAVWTDLNTLLTRATGKRALPDLLTLALEPLASLRGDPAARALIEAGDPLVLVDGLNETVGREETFAKGLLPPVLVNAMQGHVPGRVVAATRATAWDAEPERGDGSGEDGPAEREQRENAQPPPAQLRRQLGDPSVELEATPLDLVQARAALQRVDVHGRFDEVPDDLLVHPFSLGALLVLGAEKGPLPQALQDAGADLPIWTVAEALVEVLVRHGLTHGRQRDPGRPLDGPKKNARGELAWEPDQRVKHAVDLLATIALAMHEQGNPDLRHDRMLEVIWERVRDQEKDRIREEERPRAERRADRKRLVGEERDAFIDEELDDRVADLMEELDATGDWKVRSKAYLADLQAASLVLVGNEQTGYRYSHDELRDALGAKAWADLDERDPAYATGLVPYFAATNEGERFAAWRTARRIKYLGDSDELDQDPGADILRGLVLAPRAVRWAALRAAAAGDGRRLLAWVRDPSLAAVVAREDPAIFVEWLDTGLTDPVGRVRCAAFETLKAVAPALLPAHADRLLEWLNAGLPIPDYRVRETAFKALGAVAPALLPAHADRVLGWIDAGLTDPELEVRTTASEALEAVAPVLQPAHADRVLEWVDSWRTSPVITVQATAFDTLKAVAPALLPAHADRVLGWVDAGLTDPDGWVRYYALYALGAVAQALLSANADRVLGWVDAGLTDPFHVVRGIAFRALGAVAPALLPADANRVLGWVDAGLTDPAKEVRSHALEALGAMAPALFSADADRVLGWVDAGLTDPVGWVRCAAFEALKAVAPLLLPTDADRVLGWVDAGLTDPVGWVRRSVFGVLWAMAPALLPTDADRVLGWVDAGLTDPDDWVREIAVWALKVVAPALSRSTFVPLICRLGGAHGR